MRLMITIIFIVIICVCLAIPAPKKITAIGNDNIVKEYPYDSRIITQGIEKINNKIIISSGGYGQSSIGILDLKSGFLTNEKKLLYSYYSEGLTFDGSYIYQLTWKEKTIFVRDPLNLEIIKTIYIDKILWGICFAKNYFFISDGSEYLFVYDKDFQLIRKVKITYNNDDVFFINELEYYDGYIYANIRKSNYIIKINLYTGEVEQKYDFSNLKDLQLNENSQAGELNGIAYLKNGLFLITGKNWSKCYIVNI